MKKIIMVICGLILLPKMLSAYEIDENPDRKVSFGLDYIRTGTVSEYKFGFLKVSDFAKVSQNTFIADIKIPMSSILTLQIIGAYLNQTADTFLGENLLTTGYNVGIGMRFYIP